MKPGLLHRIKLTFAYPASPRKITSSKAPSKVKKRTPSKKAKSEEEDKENYPVSNGEAKAEKLVPQSRKRKAEEEPTAPPAPKIPKKGKIINQVIHKQNLNVFVCGEGTSGELGLGVTKKDIDVKRPRLNKNLDANNVGVVKIATGGMHNVALTHDNQILTWGVNDNGALGRDTAWDGGLKDMKEDDKSESSSDSGDDTGMNPRETMPTAIPKECFHENTVFIDVAAGDSVSFALTDDGKVWGWGTFRVSPMRTQNMTGLMYPKSNEGVMGFTKETIGQAQMTPVLIPQLKKIKQLACGANHALAVDADGRVFAWGSGQQDQLGRRITERSKVNALVPTAVSLKQRGKRSNAKVASVACGDYHSFAIDSGCNVWAWGANSWGETGIFDNAGDDNATILAPELIESLKEDNPSREIVHVAGGAHHSVAVSSDGECLIWGRVDGAQSGIKVSDLPKGDIKYDNGGNENNAKAGAEKPRGNPKILMKPTPVPSKSNLENQLYLAILTVFRCQCNNGSVRPRSHHSYHQRWQGIFLGLQCQLPNRPRHRRGCRSCLSHRQYSR